MAKKNSPEKTSLREISLVFLKLGLISFGGPAAHIALMEDEIVRRRKWLSHERFIDLIGAVNFIPGPNSTELAIHIGYVRAGWQGLVVAGLCFILPAVIIVSTIGQFYVSYGNLPEFTAILYGIKPVIIAIILKALWSLGKSALKSRFLVILAIIAIILNFLGINELLVLFGVGIFMALKQLFSQNSENNNLNKLVLLPPNLIAKASAALVGNGIGFGLFPLFLVFLKIGSVLFGSGYVLLAFLQGDLVERLGWLSQKQLFDAIAVGQVTPGPLFTTATFIGYILGGWKGGIVATIGIFLPAFFFVFTTGPFIPQLRKSLIFGAFLDGINVSALALMFVVTVKLIETTFIDLITIILGVISAYLLFFTSINSAWIVLLGAIIGYVIRSF